MNISYNWLKEYIKLSETPEELSEILTGIGLEVESVDEVESIKGGLKGIVIGKVVECQKHPNSDHLSITKVDVGQPELLPIVCGASNVAAGQKVVVATVGTKLYSDGKEFEIKKAKIRGEESMGMICAEDEIGVGKSHDGIMVLPSDAVIGKPAAEFFNLTSDYVFSIGLTPNRVDAASHIGVARDLAAYFSTRGGRNYKTPDISKFAIDETTNPITVTIDDKDGCFRYAGLTIEGIKIAESPKWLKDRLISIGLNPINNVVDITNFVLHELGQPLHAFDLDEIKGNKVIVKSQAQGTKFQTLDGIERTLNANDLMICNAAEGMCMAGVFGGISSGVKETTTRIFIESAWFNPVRVRKTARFHGLSTDSSFRFERGTDPNMVPVALKRAAMLVKEIAGGKITSSIIDVYPKPATEFEVEFDCNRFHVFAGKEIPVETMRTILKALEIKIEEKDANIWKLSIPPYRVDVQRQADVSEDILRIYGYNNIEVHGQMLSSITSSPKPNPETLQDKISDLLAASGYFEMMNNSITKAGYFEQYKTFDDNRLVRIINPLSSDLNCMRQSLLFGGLETLRYNSNRQRPNLKFFEFGKTYFCNDHTNAQSLKAYSEGYRLGMFLTGNFQEQNWNGAEIRTSFFDLKAMVENIFTRMGVKELNLVSQNSIENDVCREGLAFIYQKQELGQIWILDKKISRQFDIPTEIYYAELDWEFLLKIYKQNKIQFREIPKFPAVRRDLALLVDKGITFDKLKEIALRTEKQLLRSVGLFDVYEGDKIAEGKKSYALSFVLQDESKTMEDKLIDKTMQKFISAFEREVGAVLR
jgi:phenylalanyl-tRNA synthetase beta chain